jgi:hypothetical protein
VVLGVTAIPLGLAVGGFVARELLVGSINGRNVCLQAGDGHLVPTMPSNTDACLSAEHDIPTDFAIGVAGAIASGVFVATGLVVVLAAPSRPSAHDEAHASTAVVCLPRLGAGQAGATCEARF